MNYSRWLFKFWNIWFIKHRICMVIKESTVMRKKWVWREGKKWGRRDGGKERLCQSPSNTDKGSSTVPRNKEKKLWEGQSDRLFLKWVRNQKGMRATIHPWGKGDCACSFRIQGQQAPDGDPRSEQSRGRRTSSHIHFWQEDSDQRRRKTGKIEDPHREHEQ